MLSFSISRPLPCSVSRSEAESDSTPRAATPAAPKNLKYEAGILEESMDHLYLEFAEEGIEGDRTQTVPKKSLKTHPELRDLSGASDVASRLSRVNALIDGLAIQLASSWPNGSRRQVSGPHVPGASGFATEGLLDRAPGLSLGVVHWAHDAQHETPPELLRYAFQGIVTRAVSNIFQEGFYHTQPVNSPVNQMLRTTARSIQKSETQTVYGRWRSLTHRHLRKTTASHHETEWSTSFNHQLALDLSFAAKELMGLMMSEEEFLEFKALISPSVSEIVGWAVKLENCIKEDILSKNYSIFAPHTGPFDSSFMDIPAGFKVSEGADLVHFPVSLGMLYQRKQNGEHFAVHQRIFSKAVVITELALQELHQPTQRPCPKIAELGERGNPMLFSLSAPICEPIIFSYVTDTSA